MSFFQTLLGTEQIVFWFVVLSAASLFFASSALARAIGAVARCNFEFYASAEWLAQTRRPHRNLMTCSSARC